MTQLALPASVCYTASMTTTEQLAPARIVSPADVRAFILSGRAVFTVRSLRTGERRTFRVRQCPDHRTEPFYFVDALTGPENTTDYTYIGWLRPVAGGRLQFGTKRPTALTQIIEWLVGCLNVVAAGRPAPAWAQAEFWHEGRCARCGRPLTDPDSITRGLGPKCAGRA